MFTGQLTGLSQSNDGSDVLSPAPSSALLMPPNEKRRKLGPFADIQYADSLGPMYFMS